HFVEHGERGFYARGRRVEEWRRIEMRECLDLHAVRRRDQDALAQQPDADRMIFLVGAQLERIGVDERGRRIDRALADLRPYEAHDVGARVRGHGEREQAADFLEPRSHAPVHLADEEVALPSALYLARRYAIGRDINEAADR